VKNGKIDASILESEQYTVHGLAWFATYATSIREMLNWAERLISVNQFGETEKLVLQSAFGEYLSQIFGGIPMSQGEIIRLKDLNFSNSEIQALLDENILTLITNGNTADVRMKIAKLVADGNFGNYGLDDETLVMIQDQFRKFVQDQIIPHAQEWHNKDELIPDAIIKQMSELGVFGLTIPEEYQGLGMGKIAMCVVTEELSRGFLSAGSLGTRAEIASELIKLGGTDEQKKQWLPKIASGEVLTTAVFTEPNTGSDLGSLKTRGTKDGDSYSITGAKTWITHGARSDLMTVLARTNTEEKGYKGLSMFLAEKPRGTDKDPFPIEGLSGGEIEVLGYRGMKEYEIAFDNFKVPVSSLLGGEEGKGFKQLMETFESARIQTAARSVGVAQSALEVGMRYAQERSQFGKPIFSFPRIAVKIAWMVVETMIARQITYFSAREKDSDRRCDIEAGMAKLLAARVAWANADNALQVHGGNGYALEYPVSRILCDARILNIFEGAAEIQAQIVARGLLLDT
tara:strand:- start:2798 stop:4345 length:1548 start_codon:yes stop_codon:yes gene_type:complete